MALYGGIHSLVAASLFAHSLAAVKIKPPACSCLATGVKFPPYTWALWANPVVFVCLPTAVILPVHSVCKLFSTVAAVSL